MEINGEQLIFDFKEGFYSTNDEGILEKKLENCKLIYDFSFEENDEMYLSIIKYSDKKHKTISLKSFLKILEKKQFEVLFEFRSDFLKAVMLTGNIGKTTLNLKFMILKKLLIFMMR